MDLVPLLVSSAVAALLAPGLLRAFRAAERMRENYRGVAVVFPAGAIAIVCSVLALALIAAAQKLLEWEVLDDGSSFWCPYGPETCQPGGDAQVLDNSPWTLALPLGVAFLGLLDDLLDAPARGWRGHGRAVLRGELSTGAIKALGTLALALAVLAETPDSDWHFLLQALLIAATTNLFNLLDLRPGRAVKVFALLGVVTLLVTRELEPLRAVGPFAGPLLVLGLYDLRERAMLGDTGSNVLGVLAGLWLVLVLDTTGTLLALIAVVALNVYGELSSITAAIERIAPLRWLDGLGRRKLRDPTHPR